MQAVRQLDNHHADVLTHGFTVSYARGCGFFSAGTPATAQYEATPALQAEFARLSGALDLPAVQAACADAEVIVACVGDCLAQNGEGRDRADLNLSGDQQALLQTLKALGKPLIVVLATAKPLTVPWIKANVDAVVQAFSGGQTMGDALARLLTGELNPSGKLPISFAHTTGQLPVYHNSLPGWHDGRYMQVLDDAFEITTDPNEFSAVREKLEADGLEFLSAEVQMIPQNTVAPTPENIEKIQELLEMLEDNDDVQNVWHNAELPEEPEEE